MVTISAATRNADAAIGTTARAVVHEGLSQNCDNS